MTVPMVPRRNEGAPWVAPTRTCLATKMNEKKQGTRHHPWQAPCYGHDYGRRHRPAQRLRLDGLRLAGNTKMPARLIETGKDMAVAEEYNQP